jgi:hypothetical protein
MRRDEFRQRLTRLGYSDEQVGDCLSGVELLEGFLTEQAPASSLETDRGGFQ